MKCQVCHRDLKVTYQGKCCKCLKEIRKKKEDEYFAKFNLK